MDLLDFLAWHSGCDFISDLNVDSLKKRFPFGLFQAVRELQPEQWSCEEWQKAIVYMTGKTCIASCQQEYRDILMIEWRQNIARA